MRNTVVNRITYHAKENRSIFLITGDAGFGVLDEFKREFPDRFLNLGIAEQNMVGFAAGLSMAGYKVFVYDIIPFLLYRCYEQVRNDVCYQRLPVTFLGVGSGVTYAPGGITHYSVEDIAIARTLPNLVILSPCDQAEVVVCADYAMRSAGPVYVRIAKDGKPSIHRRPLKSVEEPVLIREGEGAAILFHGSVACEVLEAAEEIGRPLTLISVPMIQPLNFRSLSEKLNNVHTLVTVEEHFVDGGLGTVISEWIVRERLPFKLEKLGIRNEFIHAIKNIAGMRRLYGISADRIKHTVERLLKNG